MAIYKPQTAKQAALVTARNMTRSPFLCLPAELRNMIYEFAVAGHIILVETEMMCEKRLRNALFTPRVHEPDEKINGRWASDGGKVYSLFSLDLVCSQTRAETSLLQYRTNVFHFEKHEDLEFFSIQLNSSQLHAITDISIDYSGHSWLFDKHFSQGVWRRSLQRIFPGLWKIYISPRTIKCNYRFGRVEPFHLAIQAQLARIQQPEPILLLEAVM